MSLETRSGSYKVAERKLLTPLEVERAAVSQSPETFLPKLQRKSVSLIFLVILLCHFLPIGLATWAFNTQFMVVGCFILMAYGQFIYKLTTVNRSRVQPATIEISRLHAPKLFDFLNKLALEINGAKFETVHLGCDLQASISLKKGQPELYLGFPLLRWLTQEEFSFIAAHEIGHLGSGRAKIIQNGLKSESFSLMHLQAVDSSVFKFALSKILETVYNKLQLTLQAACLDEELRVDSIAAKHSDKMAGSINLLRISAINHTLRHWQKQFMRDRIAQNALTQNAFEHYESYCKNEVNLESTMATLEAEMLLNTPISSYHPSIKERMQHLRCEPPIQNRQELEALAKYLITFPESSAAEVLLGDFYAIARKSIHEIFEQSYGDSWRKDEIWLAKMATATSNAIQHCHKNPLAIKELGGSIGFYYQRRGEFEAARQWYEATLNQNPRSQEAQVGLLNLKLGELAGLNPLVLDDFEQLNTTAKCSILNEMDEFIDQHQDNVLSTRYMQLRQKAIDSFATLASRASNKPSATSFKARPLDELTMGMLQIVVNESKYKLKLFSLELIDPINSSQCNHVLILVGHIGNRLLLAEKFDQEMSKELSKLFVPGSTLLVCYSYRDLRYQKLLKAIPGAEVLLAA